MPAARREPILKALWPQGREAEFSVWAVLDCARDPRIYQALLTSRLEFRCLYSGKLPPALERVAPHLVELTPTNRLTATLLDDGWGRAWGVFLRIKDSANLRHHLRKCLQVSDEDGRRWLFRYQDPRVLRVYLPTCRAVERSQIFGPISSYIVEQEAGAGLLEFRADGTATTLPLPMPAIA